ncbi:MAG TPA: hypothetical protein VEZ12_21380, partial [Herpetosiphonaceae bacterium]|nr:hypothetical protein [Herpetosiphonaceae bacterium]
YMHRKKETMPKTLVIEQENLPQVVRGWLKAVGLAEDDLVELVLTEREVLLRRPSDPSLRAWAKSITDQYDAAFRDLLEL